MPWESGRLDCTAPVSAPRRWGSADGKQFWRHVTGKACTFRTEGRFGVADTLVLSQDIDEEMLRKYAVSVDANFEHPSHQGHRRFFGKEVARGELQKHTAQRHRRHAPNPAGEALWQSQPTL